MSDLVKHTVFAPDANKATIWIVTPNGARQIAVVPLDVLPNAIITIEGTQKWVFPLG